MRVYAGQATNEHEALERAHAIVDERGGEAKAGEAIEWGKANEVVVRRIDRGDRTVDGAI